MAEISAAMVKSLRERSGLPMMDCKQALMEANGDEEAALELLRKRGATAAAKKADRATSEGRIGGYVDAAKGVGALVEMQCETAPVGNNPEFRTLAAKIAKHAAITGCTDSRKIMGEKFVDDPGVTIEGLIHDVLNRIRENLKIGRIVRETGKVATYVHHTGKLGVLLVADGKADENAELVNDICMHIAAMRPEAVRREEMPPDVVVKEEDIAREQIKASGKPENMLDRILKGKMDKYFAETVLLEQAFVKDDKKTVAQVAKAAGVEIKKFVRVTVGG
ncbi:MAG TPA: translation elongation factor Ts [Phycisphaerae bacterium]|nr:translation elongation factor Ts [Phycisphaerae bacterium]